MTCKNRIGERIAEVVTEDAYERYGDKLPFSVDPKAIADKAYPALKQEAEKHGQGACRFMRKVVLLSVLGSICLVGATVAIILAVKEKAERDDEDEQAH